MLRPTAARRRVSCPVNGRSSMSDVAVVDGAVVVV
jgi:hypothetical protein